VKEAIMTEHVMGPEGGTDWSKPPRVDKGAAEDFADRLDEPYEGMSVEAARMVFGKYDLTWDAVGPGEFAEAISWLRQNVKVSDKLGPACFVFCDAKIPETYRSGWVLAVLAARDVHEGD
jgi:hypothetical protein